MSDECDRCGQPIASYEEVDAVLDSLTREDRARYRDIVAPLLREKFVGRCDGIATCVGVNWKSRCRSVERERDEALSARTRLEGEVARIHGELSNLYGRLCDTFLGGYSNDRELEIFRHGMATTASCVAAVLRGERNQAPDLSGTPATKPRGVSRAQLVAWAERIGDVRPYLDDDIAVLAEILRECGLSIDDEENGRETKP